MLVFLLALPTFAGQIEIPCAPPSPREGQIEIPHTKEGEISTPVATTDLVVKTALNLYHGMLAVF
jgi:hypothetical protein